MTEREEVSVPEGRPQYGEYDPELAKRQVSAKAATPGQRYTHQGQGLPLHHFPGLDGARPVSAGRQVGFELLGQIFFLALLSFNITFFGTLIFPDYFSRSDELASLFVDQGSLDYALEYVRHQVPQTMVASLLTALFFAFMLAAAGKTPGGILGRYRMVDVKDGKKIKFMKALGYYVIYGILGITAIVSILIWLSPFFDRLSGWHRGWLYRMFGTVAVDARENMR